MPIASELNVNTAASAMDMANMIFGQGVTVTQATYTGDPLSSGTYTGGLTTSPGAVPSDAGVILSTGRATDFTNSSGTANTNTAAGTTYDSTGVDGDAQLNAIAGLGTFDGAILNASFIPVGNFITISFTFSSEEYLEYVNSGYNDAMGVWVNGAYVPLTISSNGEVSIDRINNVQNANLYQNNPAASDPLNTEMDGTTITLSLKAPVVPGQTNTIKIAIADAGDAAYDSNVLIAADSIQSIALAYDDRVQLTPNATRVVDILGNDTDTTGTGLTITKINGVSVVPGQTVTLATGEQVTLNADGTVSITADGDVGSNTFTYEVTDGAGNVDTGFVTIVTQAVPGPDGIVQGTAGNDLIDTSYVGDPDGDLIDNNDGRGVGGTTGQADYVLAGDGDDTIRSGLGNDVLFAGDGNDLIEGGAGNDTVTGGTGNDTIRVDAGSDMIYGGADRDVVALLPTAGVNSTIYGGSGGDDYDVLDLAGWDKDRLVITYDPTNPENGTVQFYDADGNLVGTTVFSDIEHVVPCFTPGSLIATADGEVAVETLVPGDMVLTRDHGMQEIRWVGRRDLGVADLLAQPALSGVRIAAGALGNGMPRCDMVVSPQHRVLCVSHVADRYFGEHEVLVPATHLVGQAGITRLGPQQISYVHLMCDAHEIVLSDGAWTESFQPGALALSGMAAGPRAELLALFPELGTQEGLRAYVAARRTLTRFESRLLPAVRLAA